MVCCWKSNCPLVKKVYSHNNRIGYLHNPVTWYRINYAGTQITQSDFQNEGTLTSPAWLSFIELFFFCKKIPLSRHIGYVIDGSMGE